MAQNIKLKDIKGEEQTYKNVDSIIVPNTSSGKSYFLDTTNTSAEAKNLMKGKTAYCNGALVTGTAEMYVTGTKLVLPEGLVTTE